MTSVLAPGQAYKEKFAVFEQQLATGAVSRPAQLVTLSAGFMTLLVPLAVIWWRQLHTAIRVLAILGVVSFLAPFAFTGTNQGFSYAVIFLLSGVAISRAARARIESGKRNEPNGSSESS